MFCIPTKLILYLTLLANLFNFSANAYGIDTFPEILRNHSNAINEFQPYIEKTLSLEKHISSLEPNVTVVADHIDNLKKELKNLTIVSMAYTTKLNSFESYQNRTEKLQGQVSELLKTVKSYQGYVRELEQYEKSTNQLEVDIIQVKEDMRNSSLERSVISQNVDTFYQTCQSNQLNMKQQLDNVEVLGTQQQEMTKKFEDIVAAVNVERKLASENIVSLEANCIANQQEIKSKLQKLDNLPNVQDELTKKVTNLISQVEEQNSDITNNLESVRSSIDTEQKEIKKQLQKLDPLTNSQDELNRKLDDLSSLYGQVTGKQQTLQTRLTQLSSQLEEFIKTHTTLPTTVIPPTTSPVPGPYPRIVRKRVHARGNNIVITV